MKIETKLRKGPAPGLTVEAVRRELEDGKAVGIWCGSQDQADRLRRKYDPEGRYGHLLTVHVLGSGSPGGPAIEPPAEHATASETSPRPKGSTP